MSKNTERGIGLQGGPADGQAEPSAPTGGAPKPGEAPRTERAASEPQRHAAVDARPVTLLGVPSPLAEKVTALGRDVHLPAETHRVATSRPIAVQDDVPGPVTTRGSGVPAKGEPAPLDSSKVQIEAALEARNPGLAKTVPVVHERLPLLSQAPERTPPVSERTPPVSEPSKPARPTNPADRATFDASPLVVDEEFSDEILASAGVKTWLRPAMRPSIGLGIGMAFALSILLVSIVKYSALDEGDEEPDVEESTAANRPTPPTTKAAEPERTTAAVPEANNAVATGGTAVEPAETPEEKGDLLPVGSAKDLAGKDARHAAPRPRGGVTPAKKPPTGDSADATATGGSAAGSTLAPPPMPSKPATPNQPYDPDSPLPPAGE